MNKPTHTPGPWRIDTAVIEHGCCWDAAIVATVEPGAGNYCLDWELVAEARNENASLIAAAPELLEALTSMVLSFRSYPPSPAEVFARAAIAKATGTP